MSIQPTEELVTKGEALEILVNHLEKPGMIDVSDLIELVQMANQVDVVGASGKQAR